ncbi:aldose epimerase [Buttiauxella selenatireducens]|uniref:Aldose epimerase n=1 Tax=Buttiauxella selenatireducens TaxID=3073902 RepID=A0ABY9SF27_9ENTR|nr:aldose epimerase [Buttiauxella sp. R73]WMY76032.1 aldose epimerase [Buttiauxella sp. R73]
MTVWRLENERFQVEISETGGEISHIRDKRESREWMWQPRADVWNNSATQLFPVVGRLIHEGVWSEGQFLPLPAHGFLRRQPFHRINNNSDQLVLEARSTPETWAAWPWKWRVQVHITLHDEGLTFSQHIFNDDTRPFRYSVGWHPGFALPLATETGWWVDFGEEGVNGPFPTRERTLEIKDATPLTTQFPLTSEAFQAGAVYFGGSQQRQIHIRRPDGVTVLTMETGAHDWLALWGVPGEDLLCIEPLAGTTDAPDFDGQIQHKRGFRQLMPGNKQTFDVRLRFAMDA